MGSFQIGHRCASVGPRSLGQRLVGVWAKTSGDLAGREANRGQTQEARRGSAGRAKGEGFNATR